MKRHMLGGMLLAIGLVSLVSAQSWEIRGVYEAYFPEDRVWENQANGGEGKLVYWWESTGVGLALAAGTSKWDVRENPTVVGGAPAETETLRGHGSYHPIGASLLVQGNLPEYPSISTLLEAGFRYMICDSQMTVTRQTDFGGSIENEVYALHCDDGVVGRVAAGLEVLIRENPYPTKLFVHLGYQFDIKQSRAEVNDWLQYRADFGLTATFVKLGFAVPIP